MGTKRKQKGTKHTHVTAACSSAPPSSARLLSTTPLSRRCPCLFPLLSPFDCCVCLRLLLALPSIAIPLSMPPSSTPPSSEAPLSADPHQGPRPRLRPRPRPRPRPRSQPTRESGRASGVSRPANQRPAASATAALARRGGKGRARAGRERGTVTKEHNNKG